MTRWITGPVAALMVGSAQGAPLDGSDATTGMTAGTAMTQPMTEATTGPEATTTPEVTTTTGETTTTTTTGETTEPAATETSDTTTGTSGEPTVLGEYYPFDAIHSPITAEVAEAMKAVAAKGAKAAGVFAKIGGSSTVSPHFAYCLADELAITELPPTLAPTVEFFNASAAGIGKTSFNRDSEAAMAGWTATDVLAGLPSPLVNEVTAINPRFAVVLLGTHDLELPQPEGLFTFADELVAVVDTLIADGTVPILSTLPERTDAPHLASLVPRFNAVIRAVAQGRKLPLVDLNLALAPLSGKGLAADGVDLNVATGMDLIAQPCSFALQGTNKGYNRRNLITLEALERGRLVVVDGAAGVEQAPLLMGAGTVDEPIVIPGLPFVDFRSTADSTSDAIDTYPGPLCMGTDTEGPEYIYELTVTEVTTIRVLVFDQGAVDVDLHLMLAADASTCVKRGDDVLEGPVDPGTYYLSVDTLGAASAGEFAFVVLAEG